MTRATLAPAAREVDLFFIWAFALVVALSCATAHAHDLSASRHVQANSNRVAAGKFADDGVTLDLDVLQADWFPESDSGPSMKVYVFAERGRPAQIPGPMIRVREGATIHAKVHNQLAVAVVVHGLHSHPGKRDDVLQIPAGETRDATFQAGQPGAYYYWATAGCDQWNGRPYKEDSQLSGAFIVDPPGSVVPDRVFVITVWRDKARPDESLDVPVVNGKSWPYTERLEYTAGTDVRWRWLNPSGQVHPMHMHGSYYRVDSLGDGERDTPLADGLQKSVVTELLPIGGTMTTAWFPETPGRWLFHCHILAHISPDIMMLRQGETDHLAGMSHDLMHHMSGLAMGITVLPQPGHPATAKRVKPKRKLELIVADEPGSATAKGYSLLERGKPPTPVSCPGPPIVLTRGEPVAIRIKNQLNEPTAVHWHGIELESYYDGVPGWTGDAHRVTPVIQPGKSFDVYFTPPRAGTFIYHTHMKDLKQLSSGLSGAIIILPPGETFHTETDKIFMITRSGMRRDGTLLLNGTKDAEPLQWRAGVEYRLRFINMNANNPVIVTLTQNASPLSWTAFAKDGADLPAQQALALPASFTIAPGETYDFKLRPDGTTRMQLSLSIPLLNETLARTIEVEPQSAH
jgi:manganese oxidase